jgi:hypothetical protein
MPGTSAVNSARPVSLVFTVTGAAPPMSSTGWPGITFVSAPRTTRIVTEPTGTSPTGSGTPDICFASGI